MTLFKAMLQKGRDSDVAPKPKKEEKKNAEPVSNNLLAMAFAQAKRKAQS